MKVTESAEHSRVCRNAPQQGINGHPQDLPACANQTQTPHSKQSIQNEHNTEKFSPQLLYLFCSIALSPCQLWRSFCWRVLTAGPRSWGTGRAWQRMEPLWCLGHKQQPETAEISLQVRALLAQGSYYQYTGLKSQGGSFLRKPRERPEAGLDVPWWAVLLGTTQNHWPSANAAYLQWYLPRKRPQMCDVNDKPHYLDILTTAFYGAVSWITQTSKDNHKESLFLGKQSLLSHFTSFYLQNQFESSLSETQQLVFVSSKSKGRLWTQGEQPVFAADIPPLMCSGFSHIQLPSQRQGLSPPTSMG